MIDDTRDRESRTGAPPAHEPPRKRRRWFLSLVALVSLLAVALAPFAVRRMDYFRVRRVEVVGARYIPPNALLDLLALDSTKTIWENTGPLVARVKKHPQVRDATITRRLPGTLVLHVVENLPVALLTTADGMQPVDRDGRPLPIDPSRTAVDLPIVSRRDTSALHMLDGVRLVAPGIFARVSEVRWDERGGLRVILSGLTVRAAADCTAERFLEVVPVEQDVLRRGRRIVELDVRYRDQVVARVE